MNITRIYMVVGLLGLLIAQANLHGMDKQQVKNEPPSLWQKYGWYVKMAGYTAGVIYLTRLKFMGSLGKVIVSQKRARECAKVLWRDGQGGYTSRPSGADEDSWTHIEFNTRMILDNSLSK